MIKTIHRHIIREIFVLFVIIVVCLDSILMMEKILRLSRTLSEVGASFADIVKVIVLIQPQILILTVPMSFLLSVLVTYGRMHMDSEIVVMRAGGMSLQQISLPAAATGIAAFLLTMAMTFFLSPLSAKTIRSLVNETIRTRAPLSLEEGVFHTAFSGITIMIGRKSSPETMEDLFLYDTTDPARPMTISARSGTIMMTETGVPFFDIRDGAIVLMRDTTFTELSFARYVLKIDMGLDLLSEKLKEKAPFRLLADARGAATQERREMLLEFHRRLTLALINLFIIFLGPALAMHSGKHGRLSGFLYGIGVFGGYYSLLIYFESLIRSGLLPHPFAWTPLFTIGALSLLLFRREAAR